MTAKWIGEKLPKKFLPIIIIDHRSEKLSKSDRSRWIVDRSRENDENCHQITAKTDNKSIINREKIFQKNQKIVTKK